MNNTQNLPRPERQRTMEKPFAWIPFRLLKDGLFADLSDKAKLLYFFLFWRGLRIALLARDPLGALLAAGAVSMLIFHAFINIGMSLNLLPITGLPLPFVSYGGSNLLASFLAFGLLQNVHIRREAIIF